jgi:hypothetical protein
MALLDNELFQKQQKKAEQLIDDGGLPQRDLSNSEIAKLANVVVEFAQLMTGVDLYPYEYEFAWRVAHSMLIEDAREITALFSRQSGKTMSLAVIICGIISIFPLLAHQLNDSRINKFKQGVWCGIYAPSLEQSGIMWSRIRSMLYTPEAKEFLLDKEIDLDLTGMPENLVLPNGSFVDCRTAAPQSQIEGKTYHLLVLEETQDIQNQIIRASLHPMVTAVAGTIVKIGTCNRKKSEFYLACRRNKRKDVNSGKTRAQVRDHFEYDYLVAARYNPRYKKTVEQEIERLGYDSDEFRMKYRLHWLLERGMYVSPELLNECGIAGSNDTVEVIKGWGRKRKNYKFTRPNCTVHFDPGTPNIYAAIDVGKEKSTVVTVGKAFWENPIRFDDADRYYIHVLNWLELQGDDHEAQHPQILSFLANYQITNVMIDATGKGDPIYTRLKADLDKKDIFVRPFIFSAVSKDRGYKVLYQELSAHRLTYPAGATVTKYAKWKRFVNQMTDLEKSWRGQTMVVQKSPKDPNAADDFCDSLMMLCWLINVGETMDVEVSVNPFIGRVSNTVNNIQGMFAQRMKGNPYTRRRARQTHLR